MMKKLLFTFFFGLSYGVSARTDSSRHLFYLEFTAGNSSIKMPSGTFILSQVQPGACANALIAVRIVANFHLGLGYTHYSYWLKGPSVYDQVNDRYYRPGYYNVFDVKQKKRSDNVFAINTSYILRTGLIDIEPFFRAGIGIPSGADGEYSVYAKKMNEHYFTHVAAGYQNRGSQEAGFGLRLARYIGDNTVYFSVTAGYSVGVMKYLLKENTDDFFGTQTSKQEALSSTFEAWQVRVGFQFRL